MTLAAPDETWAEALFDLVASHKTIQTELGEIDSAIATAEVSALVGHFTSRDQREAAVKEVTSSLRADKAKLTADLWAVKAQIDMVTLFIQSGFRYREDLDPTR